jgi:C4-dicarboxylate transporter DctM subunit
METAILFILVLGLLFVGVPVAVSLGLSSIILIAFFSNDSMSSVAIQLFTASQNYTLLAIPFFVLASAFMSTGGVAKRIIRFAIATVGHFRGGLAMASVLACMLFAALSGSSPATVVAIGTIAIAGMRQVGYSKEFAAGVIANAGTLGILIPPSIVMVVYAAATDVSVGRMFLAGVIPGILAGLMLMIAIYIVARIKGLPAEPWRGFGEIVAGGKEAGWGLFLIIIIIGGIYGGVFTPTEAAAVAAIYSFFIAVFVYRDMGPMAGITWVNETRFAPGARRVFRFGLCGGVLFRVDDPVVLCHQNGSETVTFAGRSNLGLAISLFILVAYTAWRGEKGPAGVPAALSGRLAYLGPQPVADGPEFRRAFFNEDTRKVMVDSLPRPSSC